MSRAESSYQQSFLQRVSTPLFLVLSLLLLFAGTSVSVFAAMIVCVIAGVENSDLQARIGLAATLIGFVGSIYLLIRARRSPPSQQQQSRTLQALPRLCRLSTRCKTTFAEATSPLMATSMRRQPNQIVKISKTMLIRFPCSQIE